MSSSVESNNSEKLYFDIPTKYGFKLSCVYQEKNNVEKTEDTENKTIILCHGLLSGKEHPLLLGIKKRLINKYSICQFDFRGNGNSGGETAYGNYYDEADDLREVVLYLRNEMKKNVIAIMGHSKAGSVVLLYGKKYNDVPQIVNISGRFNLTEMPANRFTPQQKELLEKNGNFIWMLYGKNGKKTQTPEGIITEEMKANKETQLLDSDGQELRKYIVRSVDIERRYKIDMNVIKDINPKTTRILTVHGDNDETVPVENGYLHDKALAEVVDTSNNNKKIHTLVILPGVSHGYRQDWEQDKLVKAILAWIQ